MIDFARFSKPGTGHLREEPIFIDDNARLESSHFIIPEQYKNDISHILIPRGLVENRIEKIAKDIVDAYQGQEIHLLCVLKGSHVFFSKLFESINAYSKYGKFSRPLIVEHFVRLKSYEGMESTGNLQVLVGGSLDEIRQRHVLIVEDIIDTGHTLTKFVDYLKQYDCKTIGTCALVEKRTPKSNGFKGDFIGFSVPNQFIVGCGMDYNERLRDLEHIAVISSEGVEKYSIDNLHKLYDY